MLDPQMIWTALAEVVDPCSIATGVPIGLPEMGMIKAIEITRSEVNVTLRLTSPTCWQAANILAKVEDTLRHLAEDRSVICTLDTTWDWMPSMMDEQARGRLRKQRLLITEKIARS